MGIDPGISQNFIIAETYPYKPLKNLSRGFNYHVC